MRKLSEKLLTVLTAIIWLFVATAFNSNNAYANDMAVTGQPALANKEAMIIQEIMEEVNVAAQAGDEQQIVKLLTASVKRNPIIADKIIATFTDSQKKLEESGDANSVNAALIVNNVIATLQVQKSNQAVVAAILNSYAPAAGANNDNAVQMQVEPPKSSKNNNPKLPPTLPKPGENKGANPVVDTEH